MANLHINSQCGWKYKWTEDEDDIVRKYYPCNGWKEVHKFLPHREKMGIQCRANKLGIKQFQYNYKYFDNIDSCKKAYWLGFIYADGYVTTENRWGLELQYKDIGHMQNLLKEMKCNIPIIKRNRNGHNYCLFQIKNKNMYNNLVKCGVVRNKTNKIKFPDFFINENMILSFICGFFDGDGTYYCSEKGKCISCVCKKQSFLQEIQNILAKIGIYSIIRQSQGLFYLKIERKESMEIFIKKILSLPITMLDRKKDKAINILKYCLA